MNLRINKAANIMFRFSFIIAKSFCVGFSILCLVACSAVEKRSETIPRKELPKVSKHALVRTIWRVNVGKGVGGKFNSNVILVKEGNALYTADHQGTIVSLDKKNGKFLWKTKLKEKIIAGPYVMGDKLAVSCGEDSIIMLNAKTGAQLWRTHIGSEVLAVPVIDKEYVYIHSLDGRIISLNVETGNKFWEYSYSLPSIILRKLSEPIVANTNLYVGFSNGKLAALNKNSGQLEWIKDISQNLGRTDLKRMSDIASSPFLDLDMLYVVSYQGKLAKISSYSGQTIWSTKVSSYNGVYVDQEQVYVTDEIGHVIAFDKDTGGEVWRLEILQGRKLSRPIIFGNKLVVGDKDGNVHFISIKDGKYLTRYNLGNNGMAAIPLVENNEMYVLGRGGSVVALTAL